MEIPFADDLISTLVAHLAHLPAGARIPSERALAETLGVSRTALRDRLMRLEAIGVLERRAGSGTYLRELSSSMAGDTLAMGMIVSRLQPGSMVPVRVALEREAARQSAQRRDHVSHAHMLVALEQMENGASESQLREADYRFHQALMVSCGEPGLQFFSDIMRDILWVTIREIPVSERQAQLRPVHQAIYDAVVAEDPVAAMQAVDVHFEWLELMVAQGTFHTPEQTRSQGDRPAS
ncbi:MAG: FadR/GntR family transcriptional regulator [Propioniciclava sp.]